MICPECDSENIVGNGVKESGRQNYMCSICKRQFVENPSDHYRISEEKRLLVERLPPEKIPLSTLARGYSVARKSSGRRNLITAAEQVQAGV